jgi:hypothetical protein
MRGACAAVGGGATRAHGAATEESLEPQRPAKQQGASHTLSSCRPMQQQQQPTTATSLAEAVRRTKASDPPSGTRQGADQGDDAGREPPSSMGCGGGGSASA